MNEVTLPNDSLSETEKIDAPEKTPKTGGFFKELIKFIFFILVVLIPLRFFVAQPFIVVGTSMEPTFSGGEYLIVDELSYRLGEPSRGDVVIFHPPIDPKVYYIKRIIGLPNEIVDIKNDKVTIKNADYPNGFALDEQYVKYQGEKDQHIELKSDQYFVMGDNRPVSYDSRSWGPVPKKNIVGRAYLRLLPVSRVGILPGSVTEKISQ